MSTGYNLGVDKLAAWLRDGGTLVEVQREIDPLKTFDLYCFSVVFTWDLARLIELVRSVPKGRDIWIGGPAASAMPDWIRQQTGIQPVVGPDPRFERQQGTFKWCRTSRGCSVGCYFCIVPKIDGLVITEYDDFEPAPVVVDDNLLRTSWRHQELVVDRLSGAQFEHVDFNSGFDPEQFSQKHFDLYSRLPMRTWRIAFDEVREWRAVHKSIKILRANGVSKNKIFCYVLAGNEPFAHCLWRAMKVVEWGGEPRIQMMKPLNWLGSRRDVWINPKLDWDREKSINFPRYWYSYAWRRLRWDEWSTTGFEYTGPFTRTLTHSKVRDTAARAASRWLDVDYDYGKVTGEGATS